MRWQGRDRSENVEDRRGVRPVGLAVGGGGLLALVLGIVAVFLGADPRAFIGLVGQPPAQQAQQGQPAPGVDDKAKEFIEVVLKDTANQIGDDTLQRLSQGYVVPERFTHGTSAQRVRWFRAGLASGDLNACQQLFELDYSQL